MVRDAVLLVLALSLLGAAPAEARRKTTDLDAVKAQSDEWFQHVERGDADAAASLYAEDAIVMPDKAPTLVGRAAVRDYFAGMISGMRAAGIRIRKDGEITGGVSGNLGWASGTYSMVDAQGTVVEQGKYLSVHRRSGGRWQFIRDTWNTDGAPAGR